MKRLFLTFFMCCISIIVFSQFKIDGLYVGLEEMCWTDSTGKKDCYLDFAKPQWKWYHLSYLKIKEDSVFLDQSPISIFNKDTLYSSSDGAFFYYSGIITLKDSNFEVNLTELFCDYCAIKEIKEEENLKILRRTKQFKGRVISNGLIINGYLFSKAIKESDLISEHPQLYLNGN